MKGFLFAVRYLVYFFTSQTKHDIHSPFVFDLLTKAINRTDKQLAFQQTETIRKAMLKSDEVIEIRDFGAGFGGVKYIKKGIRFIARHSSKSPKYGRLIYRLVDYFSPSTMLELGTSLGISALYQASAAPAARFTTMEGCLNTAAIARKNFDMAGFKDIQIIVGDFDMSLFRFLSQTPSLDYVFIDGNHKKDPVLIYFNACLEKIHKNSILIVDDINWSKEMKEAWKEIKLNPKVYVTIDLFMMGLVFFNPDLSKQDFIIRY